MTTTRPMTKSPRAVAREALRLAEEALPAYSSKFSRKDYTRHQLFALLALKAFFKTDYRGLTQLLGDFAELRQELGLGKIPHDSALCHAAKRLLKKGSSSCSSCRPARARQRGLIGERLLGSALRGRSEGSRERECYLRVLTHDSMLCMPGRSLVSRADGIQRGEAAQVDAAAGNRRR